MGAKRSAAHWGACIVQDGHVDVHKSVQIGIRGHIRIFDWLQSNYDLGYDVIKTKNLIKLGFNLLVNE